MSRGGFRPGAGRPKKNRIQASSSVELAIPERRMTALEILETAANDKTLDWRLRIDAARALLPYHSVKAGRSIGKKEEREEAAKKAASGRFGARPAPNVIKIQRNS